MDMKSFGRSTAPVPTQSFNSANFIGTPVPQIGQVGVTPNASNVGGSGGNNIHIAVIVAILIVGGYLAHHFFFEK